MNELLVGMVVEFGKCDHFTVEQTGTVKHFYVTTYFYRCNPNFPVRPCIVVKEGPQGESKVSRYDPYIKQV